MAIHFISGKPGGGKTLLALRLMLEELVYGSRLVVTNVSLKLPELNEFIQTKYPDASVNLFERVRILSEKECEEFWKHRVKDGREDKGAFIVLDELHLFFNARKWMHTGEDCLHYLSQHRKLGDDVLCVTQHVENVDKQFRSVAQDFTVVKNGYKQRIGWFRGLPTFTRKTYSSAPNGGDKQQPFETAHFRLDAKGLASCYDTAAGIGVHGRHADKGKATKGLHPAWFAVAVLAVALFVAAVIKGLNAYAAAKINKTAASVKQSRLPSPLSSEVVHEKPTMLPPVTALPPAAERRRVRGYAIRGDRVRVLLDDGVTLSEDDDDGIQSIRRNKVRVNGETLYLVPAVDRPALAPAVMPPPSASAVVAAPSVPPPPAANTEDRWVTHSDGVSRLKSRETLAESLGLR